MQRRLTLALVATTLFSILFVGLGVLAIAQLSATADAEREVGQRLDAVADLTTGRGQRSDTVERVLTSARANLGLDALGLVEIDPDGGIEPLELRGRRNRGGSVLNAPLDEATYDDIVLGDDQVAALEAGETILISEQRRVVGLQSVSLTRPDGRPGPEVALLAGREVTAVSRRVVAWFLASSTVVLAAAVAAGLWLSRRLVKPIKEIETATAAIAEGDLAARVEVAGDDEVAELGHSVNRMAADLQRSRALDRQFLMSVSHDLRTPLTAIAGYAEALRDGAAPNPTAVGQVIGAQADRLSHLVEDLLDLARLDANRFRFDIRPFDLAVVAGRTAAGAIPEAESHGIRVTRSGPESLTAMADPDRTAQSIGNLIDNALKFARDSVHIEVGIDQASAWVSVDDDGPGISAEDLPHIFDRLYTGKAQPARAENPTGLGLATVRELINAMGGQVTASNRPGGGARMTIRLPTADITEPTSAARSPSARPAEQPALRTGRDRAPAPPSPDGPPVPSEPPPSPASPPTA